MFLGGGLLKGTEGAVSDGYGTAAVFPVAADELAEIVGCNFYLVCCIQRTYLSANCAVIDVCANGNRFSEYEPYAVIDVFTVSEVV